jgi:hypothetical protein
MNEVSELSDDPILPATICSCHTIVTHSPPFRREVKYVYCDAHRAEIQAVRDAFGPHIKFEREYDTLWEARRKAEELSVGRRGPDHLIQFKMQPLSTGRILLMAKWFGDTT